MTKDKPVLYNRKLATERGLTESDMLVLDNLYNRLWAVLQRPMMYYPSYEAAVKYVESLEIVLQGIWGFPFNPDYQTYRFSFRECSCPKLDNEERIGTGMWIYRKDCPVHQHLCK